MDESKASKMDVYSVMMRTWLFLLLFAVCGLASVFKSSGMLAQQLSLLEWSVGGDKILHFMVASSLSFCSVWATPLWQRKWLRLAGWPTLFLLVAVVIDELSQYYLPRRQFSLQDLAVNVGGIVVGVLMFTLVGKFSRQMMTKK
jgi:VanZ family protein